MYEPLAECVRGIRACGEVVADACERRDWTRATASAAAVLSWASKLHARTRILAEISDDTQREARARAEVDRALNGRARPLPGETPLPFPKPPGKGGDSPKKPPTPKGKGK